MPELDLLYAEKLENKERLSRKNSVKLDKLELFECISDYAKPAIIWMDNEGYYDLIHSSQGNSTNINTKKLATASIFLAKKTLPQIKFNILLKKVLEPIKNGEFVTEKEILKSNDASLWLRSVLGFGDLVIQHLMSFDLVKMGSSARNKPTYYLFLYLINKVINNEKFDLDECKKISVDKTLLRNEYYKICGYSD